MTTPLSSISDLKITSLMHYTRAFYLCFVLIINGLFGLASAKAQPLLAEKRAFCPLGVFQDNPDINQIEVFLTTGDTTWLERIVTINRETRRVVTENIGFSQEEQSQEAPSSRMELSYNDSWQAIETKHFSGNGELKWWETYEYNEENRLKIHKTNAIVSRDEPEKDVISESTKTYFYEGEDSRLVGWERVSVLPGFDPDISKAEIRYNKQGQRKKISIRGLDKPYAQFILARVYRWNYGENQLEQQLINPISRRRQTLRQWFNDNGQLIRETGALLVYDTERSYAYEGNLLVESKVDFMYPDEEVRRSQRRYVYK